MKIPFLYQTCPCRPIEKYQSGDNQDYDGNILDFVQVPDVYGCVQNETNRSTDALLPPIAERKIDEIFDIVEGRVTAITIETREVQVAADHSGQLP